MQISVSQIGQLAGQAVAVSEIQKKLREENRQARTEIEKLQKVEEHGETIKEEAGVRRRRRRKSINCKRGSDASQSNVYHFDSVILEQFTAIGSRAGKTTVCHLSR